MSSATAAAAAKVAKPSKGKVSQAKQEQTALPLPAPAPEPELVNIPLELVATLAQVRTEFDEDALKELAADIAARGVLQPILVRPAGEDDQVEPARFVVIAGERRLRACRIAQAATVPAIIRQVNAEEHALAQVAENIQRENLTPYELAQAVRKIHEQGKSVTEIADLLHKSKSWVSKRLAASHPNLWWQARALLEDGHTEDLELVLALDKLSNVGSYTVAFEMADKVKKGQAGRESVRQALAKAIEEKENPPPPPEPIAPDPMGKSSGFRHWLKNPHCYSPLNLDALFSMLDPIERKKFDLRIKEIKDRDQELADLRNERDKILTNHAKAIRSQYGDMALHLAWEMFIKENPEQK